jgi:putative ATP-dependent endonuclease of the OLD family
MLKKIYIENFKSIEKLELAFNNDLNIIAGDNETGKSTLLEAINLAMTGQLYGRYIASELSPYLFNKKIADHFIKGLREKKPTEPPYILIELYLEETSETASLKGTNNTARENTTGVSLKIEFDDDYKEEYDKYISSPSEIFTIPSEYYTVKWYSFAFANITRRSLPISTTIIDTTSIRLQSGADFYIQGIIDDCLNPKEKAQLALAYRSLKESFATEASLKRINDQLKKEKGKVSDKELAVSIDISQRTSWDASLTPYLDEIPFQFSGKGDQNILKTLLALDRKAQDKHIILIEEPENHLSYSTMNKLISMVEDKCEQKQLFISTHSTFVLNKLGLDKVILLGKKFKPISLKDLSDPTKQYFRKLPGYDTLRLLIAKKAILVEGPSDELIVQRAYRQIHSKLPIADGIDIISVRGLSFKRFLELAKMAESIVCVITDNDGDYSTNIEGKYKDYIGVPNISIYYDKDNEARTLESQIVKYNELSTLNKVLKLKMSNKEEVTAYMLNNKTECALKMFDSSEDLKIPDYINRAIYAQ